jgi:hypothetical protein
MLTWQNRYRDWQGTAGELADAAAGLAIELGLPDADSRPNERLVRHYVQVGILARPERRGKEAYFGFRQLTELLTARVLLSDGWPLAKIAEFTRATALEDLLDLLPKAHHGTPAQEPAQRFAPSTRAPMERSVELQKLRLSLQDTFGRGAAVARYNDPALYVRIDLTPWCHVYVERAAAGSISPEEADELGRALRHALIVQRVPKREKK